ncbi:MAG: hypothetical protein FWD11_12125 [Micrococcales bacterium]|nr:hypothetical protein [Micrococcales bacterium]
MKRLGAILGAAVLGLGLVTACAAPDGSATGSAEHKSVGVALAAAPIAGPDPLFSQVSSRYRQDLALTLASLASVATAADTTRTALVNLGVDPKDISTYNYLSMSSSTANKVAYVLAHKTVVDQGSVYALVYVIVRPTLGGEWYSNFNIGQGTDHAGFAGAEAEVLRSLDAYMSAKKLTNTAENKIVITGHSRGAAVGNLLAADLTKSQRHAVKDNVYAYTFATPNTTKSAEAKNVAAYDNIFNFVRSNDFYTGMLADWGFGKYGVTLTNADPLDGDATVDGAVAAFGQLAPDVHAYYNTKYPTVFLGIKMTPATYFEQVAGAWSGNLMGMVAVNSLWNDPVYGAMTNFLLKDMNRTNHAMTTYYSWVESTPYAGFRQC